MAERVTIVKLDPGQVGDLKDFVRRQIDQRVGEGVTVAGAERLTQVREKMREVADDLDREPRLMSTEAASSLLRRFANQI